MYEINNINIEAFTFQYTNFIGSMTNRLKDSPSEFYTKHSRKEYLLPPPPKKKNNKQTTRIAKKIINSAMALRTEGHFKLWSSYSWT